MMMVEGAVLTWSVKDGGREEGTLTGNKSTFQPISDSIWHRPPPPWLVLMPVQNSWLTTELWQRTGRSSPGMKYWNQVLESNIWIKYWNVLKSFVVHSGVDEKHELNDQSSLIFQIMKRREWLNAGAVNHCAFKNTNRPIATLSTLLLSFI